MTFNGKALDSDVGLVTGEFFQEHTLAPYSSRGGPRALQLQYSSLRADPRPVLQYGLTTQPGSNSASILSISARFVLDGVDQGTVTYNNVALQDGDSYRVSLQADARGLGTGVHDVQIDVTKTFVGGGTASHSYFSATSVVDDSAGSLGSGWGFGRLTRLQTTPTADPNKPLVLLSGGGQFTEKYTTTDGTNFTGPPEDPSTLTKDINGTWTWAHVDGSLNQFDADGRQTSATDRNGNATTYTYVSSGAAAGALQTVTDPAGLVTTLAYDGAGTLQTVTDPANRVTNFTVNAAGDLTQITDPDGAVTKYSYDSDHKLVTETNPNTKVATVTYGSFGRVASETLFGGTVTTNIAPADTKGLLAPGGTGALPTPATYQGSITDPNGKTTTLSFDHHSHPSASTDGTSGTTTFVRDSHGWPTAVTDPLNRTTNSTYDTRGNLTQVTRPDSSTMTVVYDPNFSVPTQVTDFRGLTTTFTLDAAGNVTRRTDPDTNHEDYTYDTAGQVLTATDRNGSTTSFSYDATGRLSTITEPNAGAGTATVTMGYDLAGNLTSVTDELGHVTRMTYDNVGRMLTVADPIQYAAGKATTSVYDAAGNLTSVTDALGHKTSSTYDARNRPLTMVDPVNQGTTKKWSFTWDGMNLTTIADPLGHATNFTYDGMNRPVTAKNPLNQTDTTTYDLAGQVVSVANALGNATTFTYDTLGRLATVTRPGTAPNGSGQQVPVVSTYGYNANNQVTSVTDPLGHATTTAYDNLGRPTSVTDALGHATTTGYDLVGNLTSVTDALGHATTATYDARNRVLTQTRPAGGGTTSYDYDQHNRLTSLTDPVSNVTSWAYDDADRMTVETDPRGKLTTSTYDLVANLTGRTDRNGRLRTFGYDADDRPATEAWMPSGGGTPLRSITTTYDGAGRVTGITDPDSTYAYTYDNADRVKTVSNAGTPGMPYVLFTSNYDAGGRRYNRIDNHNGTTGYIYDIRDQLTTVRESGTGISSKRADFAYDAAGRRTTLTRYTSLAPVGTVLVTSYDYDDADRLSTLAHKTAGGTVRSQYVFTLDDANRLTQEARTWTLASGMATDTVGYSYTNDDQLTGVTHSNSAFAAENFSYDANGNRTLTGYVTTTGNRLASDGTFNYAYDDEGNRTVKTEIATGNQTLYTWDYRNRLTKVESVVGSTTTVLAQYVYDALDRRIKVVEGGVTRWTAYEGIAAVLDFDGAGAVSARYLQGPMVDEVLARDTPSGGVAWYLPDRLGTIRDLANNGGAIIDHVDYDVYGKVTGETAPAAGDRWKFTGRELSNALGLQYHRARYYDAGVGRWIGNDPITFKGGDTNLYRYVHNDPLNRVDPTGLDDEHILQPAWNPHKPPPPPNYPPSTEGVLKKIRPIAWRTWIWDFAPEGCERWAFAFEENLRGFSDPNVKYHGIGWEPSNAIGGGHAVYDFNLFDGTIIRVDHWIYYGGTRCRVIPPNK